MTPPPPMVCDVPGCEFKTPDGIPTYDQCLQRLQIHTTAIHTQRTAAAAAVSKPDKLKRPNVSDGITEADWVWFEDRWTRYKESTGLEGVNVVNQLWDCASEDLARRCYEAGPSKDITEKDLLIGQNEEIGYQSPVQAGKYCRVFVNDPGQR